MCINRVIASDLCGTGRGAAGPEPILWYLWFEDSLACFTVPLSSFQGRPGAGDRCDAQ